jgi:hypothetical protein
VKTLALMVAALNYDLGLRSTEHHRLLCAYGRKRCVRTMGWTRFIGVGDLELVATNYNPTKV